MTLVLATDSASPPNVAQLLAAKAAGVQAWNGYLASGPNEDILDPWTEADFKLVLSVLPYTLGYVSGLDDPEWLKATAESWGIPIALDDETGVRADGVWTDPFLTASGAGLYGGSAVQKIHLTHAHPFYIFSEYPTGGNPTSTNWPPGIAAPLQPKGWQYSDSGSFGGLTVDLSIFDEAIYEEGAVNNVGYVVEYADPNYDSDASAEWLVRPDYSARIHLATSPDVTFATSQGAIAGTISAAQMAQIPDLTVGPAAPAAVPGPQSGSYVFTPSEASA